MKLLGEHGHTNRLVYWHQLLSLLALHRSLESCLSSVVQWCYHSCISPRSFDPRLIWVEKVTPHCICCLCWRNKFRILSWTSSQFQQTLHSPSNTAEYCASGNSILVFLTGCCSARCEKYARQIVAIYPLALISLRQFWDIQPTSVVSLGKVDSFFFWTENGPIEAPLSSPHYAIFSSEIPSLSGSS